MVERMICVGVDRRERSERGEGKENEKEKSVMVVAEVAVVKWRVRERGEREVKRTGGCNRVRDRAKGPTQPTKSITCKSVHGVFSSKEPAFSYSERERYI